jgi:hypothetical protein
VGSGTLVCSMMKTCLFEALPFFHLFFQNDHKHILRCKLYRYFCTACPFCVCVCVYGAGAGLLSLTLLSCIVTRESNTLQYNVMGTCNACLTFFPILEPDLFPHAPSILAFTTFIHSEHTHVAWSSKQEHSRLVSKSSSFAAISSARLVLACQ